MTASPRFYDTELAAQAPSVTRAQRQEGYDTAPLAPNRRARQNASSSDVELHRLDTYTFPGPGSGRGTPERSPATPSPASSKSAGIGRAYSSSPGSHIYSPRNEFIAGVQVPETDEDGDSLATRPWYRRRWTIIGLVVLALIVVGAVVGGAVGARNHKSKNDSASGGTQGQGQATTSSNPFGASIVLSVPSSTPSADDIAGVGSLSDGGASTEILGQEKDTKTLASIPAKARVPWSHSQAAARRTYRD
ncbi:hypothetical protein C8F01DRAFT_454344 [Mycena amicta]|nr:hypothetical protein C8F01DRAFT_454344 [Mycena amicta]